jgi:hypothetical protein
MTPEQERNRERRLLLLEEKLDAMKSEGRERDSRLLRAERRIMSLWGGLALITGIALVTTFWQAASSAEEEVWEWTCMVFVGAVLAVVLREAAHAFERN